MKYPMDFEMSAAELIDMCDKPIDEMDSCEHCIMYRMCCWHYIQETLENDKKLKEV